MKYGKTYSMNINAHSIEQAKRKANRLKVSDDRKAIITNIKLSIIR